MKGLRRVTALGPTLIRALNSARWRHNHEQPRNREGDNLPT